MEDSVVIIEVMRDIHANDDFFEKVCTAGTIRYNTNINGIASAQKFVVDDVFHNVAGIVLTIVQSGITEADICIIVFVWIFEIGLSFHIIALCHGNEERIDDVLHIVGNQSGVDLFVLHTGQCIGYIRRIGQRTDSIPRFSQIINRTVESS